MCLSLLVLMARPNNPRLTIHQETELMLETCLAINNRNIPIVNFKIETESDGDVLNQGIVAKVGVDLPIAAVSVIGHYYDKKYLITKEFLSISRQLNFITFDEYIVYDSVLDQHIIFDYSLEI